MKLNDRIAIITGAASGIGLATAKAFADAGAYVFVGDIAEEQGQQAAVDIRGKGQGAEFVRLDVTDDTSIAAFAKAVQESKGRVDIIASVAGWSRTEPFVENTPEFWDKQIALNLMGHVKVIHTFLPGMMERRSGRIITVASDAGRVGSLGETIYSAAKGGVIAFSKSLARETVRYSINVNCVCPGPTDTQLMADVPEKVHEALIRAIPKRRLGQPSEIADAILFFACPRSEYVTGQVLSVSGGLTMAD
jgi:2-hydroxycyclohexanecarboxyl-CoA dehydrogenase